MESIFRGLLSRFSCGQLSLCRDPHAPAHHKAKQGLTLVQSHLLAATALKNGLITLWPNDLMTLSYSLDLLLTNTVPGNVIT